MSKSLKKLIDINRLREFKNKLVGTGSAYVQTAAVDQTVAGTKTFSKPIAGSVTGSSGSCTGNAATATKAVSADSATNASHATSADKATKAELDGNGNNIVASYVAAGSEDDSTTDIGAFMAARPSFIKSFTYNNVWTDAISMRHRNGSGDGPNYGTYIRSSEMTGVSNLLWNHQYAGNWQGERTLVDSANLAGFIESAVTSLDASKLTGTASVSTTGNAATATNATNSNAANQLQAFVNDDFTSGNHYVKAIRSSQGWSTHLWMCYNNGAKMADEVSVNYANSAGSANTANSATTATYANWLRTSSHSDHLFHTEWDGGYFWTYVTTGGGDYRAVRVARSDSAATAQACTGNAATATKLATARTIALSGAATGTATSFDGSGNITIPVTALSPSAIRAQWYAAYPDGAEAHNAMWGGRDITAAFNNGTVSANIANGTFRDIFPGDYITKQVTISGTAYNVNWVVADCDYWINKGDTAMTAHHVVIVPQAPIFSANMNATNTTEGGYAGSEMYRNVIPACATGIVNAFGSDHILTFRDAISNSVDTSAVSSGITPFTGAPGWWGTWVSVQCNLMSEKMVYGAPVCAAGAMDNVMATRQMSAFRLSERLINYNKQEWWLRDVVSSAGFAAVAGGGFASTFAAFSVFGVRPFALLV